MGSLPLAALFLFGSMGSGRGGRVNWGGEEEVWIVEMTAVMGWKMTWSAQAEAGVEEEEAWIVTSLAHPSSVNPQLGLTGWSEVFS